jgi:hypothetical protein
METVLKTVVPATVPWVRIPPLPPSPRMRDYMLDDKGVHIGEKFYPYSRFKSYSLATLGNSRSVDFMPLERFRPPITIYMSDEQESMILEKLSGILPYEERRQDTIDWLMHRLRF